MWSDRDYHIKMFCISEQCSTTKSGDKLKPAKGAEETLRTRDKVTEYFRARPSFRLWSRPLCVLALVGLRAALWILHYNTVYAHTQIPSCVLMPLCLTSAHAPPTSAFYFLPLSLRLFVEFGCRRCCVCVYVCVAAPHVQLCACCITPVVSQPARSSSSTLGPSLCKKDITAEQRQGDVTAAAW